MADQVADFLSRSNLTQQQKAELWEMFKGSGSADDLTTKLQAQAYSGINNQIKAGLWDLKQASAKADFIPSEVTVPPTLGQFAENLVASGANAIGGIATAAAHPLQTTGAALKVGTGMAQKLIPGTQDNEKYADAVINMVKERYGSLEKFSDTLYNDPFGTASDLSVLFSGVGGVAKALGVVSKAAKLGRTGNILSKVGDVGLTAGAVTDPTNIAVTGLSKAIGVGGTLEESLYQRALKPGFKRKDFPDLTAKAGIGISAGIPVSEQGVKKLQQLMMDVNDEIQTLVDSRPVQVTITPKNAPKALPSGPITLGPTNPGPVPSQAVVYKSPVTGPLRSEPFERWSEENVNRRLQEASNAQMIDLINEEAEKSGLMDQLRRNARTAQHQIPLRFSDVYDVKLAGVIDPKKIAERVQDVIKVFKNQAVPQPDLAKINDRLNMFLEAHPEPMSASTTQSLKRGTYRQLKDRSYGQLSTAETETEKALARGMKEELADMIPEIGSLHAKESEFIGLEKELLKAVHRESKTQMIGLGQALTGGAATISGGLTEGATVGILHRLLDMPSVKSKLAIAINRARQLNPKRFGPARIADANASVDRYLNELVDLEVALSQENDSGQ
jgi:hypothetical protein